MAHKLTEFEINQIIIEEAKSAMKEQRQLDEVGFGALGLRAAAPMAGSALSFLGTKVLGPVLKSLGKAMFTSGGQFSLRQTALVGAPTSAYLANIFQAWVQQSSSNPDTEKILKLIPDDASEPLSDSMVAYSQEYANFLAECCSYIFNATDFYSRFKEYWVPSLGLDRVMSGADYAPTATIDYTPNNPSTEAIGRRQAFIEQANEITVANSPISPTPIKQAFMKDSLTSLVKKMIASEWQYARDRGTEDRFRIKSEDAAETALLKLVDRVVSSAVNANKIVLSGVAETEKQVAAEVEKGGDTPEEARKQAQTAVSTNVRPTYQVTNLTQEDILNNKGVLKKFDRSLPSGAQGEGIVRVLQGLLQTAGIRIGIDGYFGPRTEKAVIDFQKRNRLEATGRVDKETMEELIERSVEQELNNAESGELLPINPKQFGQQTERGSDNSLPFPDLVKKIERLESLLPKAKNSEKLKARIERAKNNLQVRLAKRIERQQRRSKKMKLTSKQLEEMVIQEVKTVLAEQASANLSSADSILQYLQSNGSWNSWGSTDQDRIQVASRIFKTMSDVFAAPPKSYEELQRNDKILGLLAEPLVVEPPAEGGFKNAVSPMYTQLRQKMPTQVSKPSQQSSSAVDLSGIPADWRKFASVSPKHAEMARVWIAATTGDNLKEAVLPKDSSYSAFQKWYQATAAELKRQFGPSEAIELIKRSKKEFTGTLPSATQSSSLSIGQAASPAAATGGSVVAMTSAAPAIEQAVQDLRNIEKRLKAKKGPTKTVTYDFSKVDEFLPGDIADFGKMTFAKGPLGNRKRAISLIGKTITMLALLKDVIAQGEDVSIQQNEEIKMTAEEIKIEMEKIESGFYDRNTEPDEFEREFAAAQARGELDESIYNRWQKLIKG